MRRFYKLELPIMLEYALVRRYTIYSNTVTQVWMNAFRIYYAFISENTLQILKSKVPISKQDVIARDAVFVLSVQEVMIDDCEALAKSLHFSSWRIFIPNQDSFQIASRRRHWFVTTNRKFCNERIVWKYDLMVASDLFENDLWDVMEW